MLKLKTQDGKLPAWIFGRITEEWCLRLQNLRVCLKNASRRPKRILIQTVGSVVMTGGGINQKAFPFFAGVELKLRFFITIRVWHPKKCYLREKYCI